MQRYENTIYNQNKWKEVGINICIEKFEQYWDVLCVVPKEYAPISYVPGDNNDAEYLFDHQNYNGNMVLTENMIKYGKWYIPKENNMKSINQLKNDFDNLQSRVMEIKNAKSDDEIRYILASIASDAAMDNKFAEYCMNYIVKNSHLEH